MEAVTPPSNAEVNDALSPEIVTVLAIFQSAFTYPTWEQAQVLIIGTHQSVGRRQRQSDLRH